MPFTNVNRGTARLFIANPFSAGEITGLFVVHHSLHERSVRGKYRNYAEKNARLSCVCEARIQRLEKI